MIVRCDWLWIPTVTSTPEMGRIFLGQ